jgi:hypothetical protein
MEGGAARRFQAGLTSSERYLTGKPACTGYCRRMPLRTGDLELVSFAVNQRRHRPRRVWRLG